MEGNSKILKCVKSQVVAHLKDPGTFPMIVYAIPFSQGCEDRSSPKILNGIII